MPGHRRQSSVRVAEVIVPQHLITAATRNSVRFSMQRRPTLCDVPEEAAENDTNGRPRYSRFAPKPLDLESNKRERQASAATSASSPRSTGNQVSPRTNMFARSSRIITIEEPNKSPRGLTVEPRLATQTWEKYNFQQDPAYNQVVDADGNPVPEDARKTKRRTLMEAVVPDAVQQSVRNVAQKVRKSSMYEVYEKAKVRGVELERKRWVQLLYEFTFYTLIVAFIYFVLIGMPLWRGLLWHLYLLVQNRFILPGGWAITMGIAFWYAFFPLIYLFEKDPPTIERPADFDRNIIPGIKTTALLIPCYKSATIIGPTLVAALKVFPAKNIFVLANGNSETPLDNTEEVCQQYGVNHVWSPIGSKIVAQFVGCFAAKEFDHVLLIDDDCAIPPNFPIVTDQLVGNVQCIGYTIKSVGPNSSKGTYCTQAQDLEYKLSGLQRLAAGKIGSATFPHGAISLWDRAFLIETFYDHPGFTVSEDWFFGHSCRRLGGRIKMCSAVFVETETPDAIFFGNGGDRGGFGEMTVFKQRFLRWNFFFVHGMFYDLWYIFFSWKLGWWEIGAKIFVFQEVYETLIYLITPFMLPICFAVNPIFTTYLLLATMAMYFVNIVIFNELHLRRRNERVSWSMMLVYYMPYKFVLTLVNVVSCFWSLFKYAQYFAKPHLKVTEDEKAIGIVMHLDDETPEGPNTQLSSIDEKGQAPSRPRSMIINVVGSRISVGKGSRISMGKGQRLSVLNQGQLSYVPEGRIGDPEMGFAGGSTIHEESSDGQQSDKVRESTTSSMYSSSQESEYYASKRKSSWTQGHI